jgi:hypothetical protein
VKYVTVRTAACLLNCRLLTLIASLLFVCVCVCVCISVIYTTYYCFGKFLGYIHTHTQYRTIGSMGPPPPTLDCLRRPQYFNNRSDNTH